MKNKTPFRVILKRLLYGGSPGFTLAEVLVSLIIVALLMSAVAMLMVPASEIIRSIRHNSYADTVSVELGDYMESRLSKANQVHFINADGADSFGEYIVDSSGNYLNCALVIDRKSGRIYDYSNLLPTTTADDIVSDPDNQVYLDSFYNNSMYITEIETVPGQNNYVKFMYTPYRDGEVLSGQRTKSFFLLNRDAIMDGDYSPAATTDYIMIYYKKYIFL